MPPQMTPITPELASAIANAYEVFGRYSLDGEIEVCRCNVCVSPQIERALIETPLRTISRELLAEYTSSAHGYSPGKIANDFRYLLPRYFELIASDQIPTLHLDEAILSRLAFADYRNVWPTPEVAAVDRFFAAWFSAVLTAPIALRKGRWYSTLLVTTAHDALAIVACAGGGATQLLDIWNATQGRAADLQLAAFAIDLVNPLVDEWMVARERLSDLRFEIAAMPLWLTSECSDGQDLGGYFALVPSIIDWLSQPNVRSRLEAAFLREDDPDAAFMFALGEQIVTGIAAHFGSAGKD
jgi:hypothetical protein